MNTRQGLLIAFATAVTATFFAVRPISGYARADNEFAIIVAKESSLDNFALADLKHVYQGVPMAGPGGKHLIPLNLPTNSPDRVAFDQTVLGMAPEKVSAYWIDKKIRGQPGAPKSIDTPELLLRVVSRIEGSIGYVRANQVSKDVKVVHIDGKVPGEAGYKVVF